MLLQLFERSLFMLTHAFWLHRFTACHTCRAVSVLPRHVTVSRCCVTSDNLTFQAVLCCIMLKCAMSRSAVFIYIYIYIYTSIPITIIIIIIIIMLMCIIIDVIVHLWLSWCFSGFVSAWGGRGLPRLDTLQRGAQWIGGAVDWGSII